MINVTALACLLFAGLILALRGSRWRWLWAAIPLAFLALWATRHEPFDLPHLPHVSISPQAIAVDWQQEEFGLHVGGSSDFAFPQSLPGFRRETRVTWMPLSVIGLGVLLLLIGVLMGTSEPARSWILRFVSGLGLLALGLVALYFVSMKHGRTPFGLPAAVTARAPEWIDSESLRGPVFTPGHPTRHPDSATAVATPPPAAPVQPTAPTAPTEPTPGAATPAEPAHASAPLSAVPNGVTDEATTPKLNEAAPGEAPPAAASRAKAPPATETSTSAASAAESQPPETPSTPPTEPAAQRPEAEPVAPVAPASPAVAAPPDVASAAETGPSDAAAAPPSPANSPALTARDESAPPVEPTPRLAAAPRPAAPGWMTSLPAAEKGAVFVRIESELYSTLDECRSSLLDAAKRAVNDYLVSSGAAFRPKERLLDWIDPAVLRQTIQSEFVEEVPLKSLDGANVMRLWALLKLTPDLQKAVESAWRASIIEGRLIYAALASSLVLLLISTAFAYLRLDLWTAGIYRRRLRLAAALAVLLTCGGAYAVTNVLRMPQ